MSINKTPAYNNTLVSGELTRPWKQNELYEEIFNTDKAVYDSINAIQINGKGRIIEIIVNEQNIRSQLLSTGLCIGNETIFFRPYNGVFALLKNVPLEATKQDILQLSKLLIKWKISGPAPTSRISPQYDILRDGRAIITGRWICMLDAFPEIKIGENGKYDFTVKAFGGRMMAFSLSHKHIPSIQQYQNDPNDYTKPKEPNLNNPNTASNIDNNASSLLNQHKSTAAYSPPNHQNLPAAQETGSPTDEVSNPLTSTSTTKQQPSKDSKDKEPDESKQKTPPSKEAPKASNSTLNSSNISNNSYLQIDPSPTHKLNIKGFSSKNNEQLLSHVLEQFPNIQTMYNPNNYPLPKVWKGTNQKLVAVMLVPKHVAQLILSVNGNKKSSKLVITRHDRKSHLHGLVIKGIDKNLTENELIDALRYTHEEEHFSNITNIELKWDKTTNTKLLTLHVPQNQLNFFLTPIVVNGIRYPVTAAHQFNKLPQAAKGVSNFPRYNDNIAGITLKNRYSALETSDTEDSTVKDQQTSQTARKKKTNKTTKKLKTDNYQEKKLHKSNNNDNQIHPMDIVDDDEHTPGKDIDIDTHKINKTDKHLSMDIPDDIASTPDEDIDIEKDIDILRTLGDPPTQETGNNNDTSKENLSTFPNTDWTVPDNNDSQNIPVPAKSDTHFVNQAFVKAEDLKMDIGIDFQLHQLTPPNDTSDPVSNDAKTPTPTTSQEHVPNITASPTDIPNGAVLMPPDELDTISDDTINALEKEQNRTAHNSKEELIPPKESSQSILSEEKDSNVIEQQLGEDKTPSAEAATVISTDENDQQEKPTIDKLEDQCTVTKTSTTSAADACTEETEEQAEIITTDPQNQLTNKDQHDNKKASTPQDDPTNTPNLNNHNIATNEVTENSIYAAASLSNDAVSPSKSTDVSTSDSDDNFEDGIRYFKTPTEPDNSALVVKTSALFKRPHGSDSSDNERGRPTEKKPYIKPTQRMSHSVETDSNRESSPEKIRTRSRTPLKSRRRQEKEILPSSKNSQPSTSFRQRSPHPKSNHYNHSNIPSSSANPIMVQKTTNQASQSELHNKHSKILLESSPAANTSSTHITETYKNDGSNIVHFRKYLVDFNPHAVYNKLISLRQHQDKPVPPKTLLDLILALTFNYKDLHEDIDHQFKYLAEDHDKITALLLFYEVSQTEDDIAEWPPLLPSLPHKVAENWKGFCRSFKRRGNSNHSWSDGPADMEKYIGIAKDLTHPAKFATNAFRNIARTTTKDHNSKKLKTSSSNNTSS